MYKEGNASFGLQAFCDVDYQPPSLSDASARIGPPHCPPVNVVNLLTPSERRRRRPRLQRAQEGLGHAVAQVAALDLLEGADREQRGNCPSRFISAKSYCLKERSNLRDPISQVQVRLAVANEGTEESLRLEADMRVEKATFVCCMPTVSRIPYPPPQ